MSVPGGERRESERREAPNSVSGHPCVAISLPLAAGFPPLSPGSPGAVSSSPIRQSDAAKASEGDANSRSALDLPGRRGPAASRATTRTPVRPPLTVRRCACGLGGGLPPRRCSLSESLHAHSQPNQPKRGEVSTSERHSPPGRRQQHKQEKGGEAPPLERVGRQTTPASPPACWLFVARVRFASRADPRLTHSVHALVSAGRSTTRRQNGPHTHQPATGRHGVSVSHGRA